MKELSLALTLILTGLGMSKSKHFNPVPHAPLPAAVEAISVGSDSPDAPATVADSKSEPVEVALLTPIASNSLTDNGLRTEAQASPITLAEQMLAESNRLGPYRTLDSSLCRAAQDYADHLARTRQQGHFADGDPEYRAKRAGFTGSLLTPGKPLGNGEASYGIGEVLAFGHPDVPAAFDGWMHSNGHREAIEERTYDVAGFGRNGTVFVGMFGNSKVSPVVARLLEQAKKSTRATKAQPAPQPQAFCTGPNCGPAMQSRPVQYQYQPRRGLFGRR